jgi:hypothetical protein
VQILYIWDGRHELPNWRKACIDSTMSLYPDAEYFCISRFPTFHSDRFTMINWFEMMEQMRSHFGLKATPYRWQDPVCFSDWARFWFLGMNGDTLYLDTDAEMVKLFDFEAECKVVYSPGNICLLYTPKVFQREHFLVLQEAQAKKSIGLLMGFHTRFSPSWATAIPQEYFRHRRARAD